MKVAPRISLVTHLYNLHAALHEQLRHWKSYPREVTDQVEFLIVDDHSDEPIQIDKGHLNIRLFRVTDEIDWNMAGCKNLAACVSLSEWLLFFDIDNMVTGEDLAKLVGALDNLSKTTMYRFRRLRDGVEVDSHVNTMLVSRWGFFKAGAIDEDFVGCYGYEDIHFHNMWNKYVGNQVLLTDVAFLQLGYSTTNLDRDLTRNYEMIYRKVITEGCKSSVGKLRFHWEEVVLS